MSYAIWKNSDQIPEEYELILFDSYEWDEPELGHYQGGLFIPHNDGIEPLESGDIEKWCYHDDLIAQANKAERAIWWLKEIVENHRFTPITTALMALTELGDENNI
jgi:hypothetical protein